MFYTILGQFCFGHGYGIDSEFAQLKVTSKLCRVFTFAPVKLSKIANPKADVYAAEESVHLRSL